MPSPSRGRGKSQSRTKYPQPEDIDTLFHARDPQGAEDPSPGYASRRMFVAWGARSSSCWARGDQIGQTAGCIGVTHLEEVYPPLSGSGGVPLRLGVRPSCPTLSALALARHFPLACTFQRLPIIPVDGLTAEVPLRREAKSHTISGACVGVLDSRPRSLEDRVRAARSMELRLGGTAGTHLASTHAPWAPSPIRQAIVPRKREDTEAPCDALPLSTYAVAWGSLAGDSRVHYAPDDR